MKATILFQSLSDVGRSKVFVGGVKSGGRRGCGPALGANARLGTLDGIKEIDRLWSPDTFD